MLNAGAKTVPMLEQCFFKVEVSADQSEYTSFFEPEGFQKCPTCRCVNNCFTEIKWDIVVPTGNGGMHGRIFRFSEAAHSVKTFSCDQYAWYPIFARWVCRRTMPTDPGFILSPTLTCLLINNFRSLKLAPCIRKVGQQSLFIPAIIGQNSSPRRNVIAMFLT